MQRKLIVYNTSIEIISFTTEAQRTQRAERVISLCNSPFSRVSVVKVFRIVFLE